MSAAIIESRKSVQKLQTLLETEKWAQEKWKTEKVFEVDAPKKGEEAQEKFFGNFPFPYMNGLLHMGHAFTFSKVEFTSNFERLMEKRVIFPFAFHLTGMPIKASADKIKNEAEQFGKNFEVPLVTKASDTSAESLSNPKKPSKVSAKSGSSTYQFEILRSMGVPPEEISEFADPRKWIDYFPPKAVEDLTTLGLGVDWRRSFVTTDANPYYDSFVKWQMRKLLNDPGDLIFEGERLTIYSPVDRQPCLDHDRSSGEGVGVQEYTCIKIQVLIDKVMEMPREKRFNYNGKVVGDELSKLMPQLNKKKLFLIAATMRPETMYGQVCCYVSPHVKYGIFDVNADEVWVCTDRSARNMAFQNMFPSLGEVDKFSGTGSDYLENKICSIGGEHLIGMPLRAPLSKYDVVYTLPMENIQESVGTGIVTSVPSDSADDLINLKTLAKKYKFYGISADWVFPFLNNYPRIIETKHGDSIAEYCLGHFNINSHKDKVQLEEAKAYMYKEGFYNGKMLVGDYKGLSVMQAKGLVRYKLVNEGHAFVYGEPAGRVISRSGDECVVKPCHQWFINYGEEKWKEKALKCMNGMNLHSREVQNAFVKNFDWLGPWACCREFGLGTRLPWDERYLVESLSDSTIYMAYYTVAHYLHCNSLHGNKVGPANIKPDQMTDKVWDYLFGEEEYSDELGIKKAILDEMKNEFNYFYPFDIRCSGKDLIFNHLTFCIYIHTAIFPEKFWPKSFLVNGHLLLNGDKMSKSTGNFLTINQSIARYGSDATRIGLADAGDSLEDANFVEKVADGAILKLHADRVSAEALIDCVEKSVFRVGGYNLFDEVFIANIAKVVENTKQSYQNALFRDCIKYAFHGLSSHFAEYCKLIRSFYRSDVKPYPLELHGDLVKKYIEVSALILSPICPHWSEYIWTTLLKNKTSVRISKWPEIHVTEEERASMDKFDMVKSILSKIRSDDEACMRKLAKASKKTEIPPIMLRSCPKNLVLYVTSEYPEWEVLARGMLRDNWDSAKNNCTVLPAQIVERLGISGDKQAMSFVIRMRQKAQDEGLSSIELKYTLDQKSVISAFRSYILDELAYLTVKDVAVMGLDFIEILESSFRTGEPRKVAARPYPGVPTYELYESPSHAQS